MKFLLSIFLVFSVSLVFAEKQPFERYQSILDRMPFGAPPPGFAWDQNPNDVQKGAGTAKELTVEQENLQKSVSFSVMDVMDDGTVRVGFSDLSDTKSPRHYFMKVGEERDGWLVREADPAKREMTVVKDQIEVTLALGASSSGGEAASTGSSGASSTAANSPRTGLLNRGALAGRNRGLLGAGGTGGLQSMRSRREQRLQAEARQAAADAAREEEKRAKAADDAARKAEEDAAREAERAEQRQQLMAIQEELRKAREEKQRQLEEARESEGGNASDES